MTDDIYMQRCLELANLGMGSVSPNPLVGCVIVSGDKVIGEGYHAKFGEAHAEVNAINSVITNYGEASPGLLAAATVYVSLEPCAHFGKTPPCADLLIRHQVKKVVIGNTDPFDGVNGKGIEKLKNAGIEVISGMLAEKCSLLNRRFFTRILKQRPYVILKWATTADGYFAASDASQRWISGALAKKLVHKWRAEEDAILVGKNTAKIDNPQLNVREWEGKDPIRIIIDRNLELSPELHVFNNEVKTVIFNEKKTEVVDHTHFIQMEDMQYYLPQKIAFQLYLMDIQSVIIEGGAQLLGQFIDANLWDEARVFSSNRVWNEGIPSPQVNGRIIDHLQLENDTLTIFHNHQL